MATAATVSEGWLARHWGVAEGLPIASVTAMVQGREGYLWLATFDGLVRFDGVRFTVFRSTDHPELPSDRLTTVHQDRGGGIWVTTEQHHLLRLRDGQFTLFHRGNGLPDDRVLSWFEAEDGTMWFGTFAGVARYRDGRMEPFAPERVDTWILAIAQQRDGTLWLGSAQHGIFRSRNGEIRRFGLDDGLPSMSVEALRVARDGTLWAGTRAGLARWSGTRFEAAATPQDPRDAYVLDLEEDAAGSLYLATRGGLQVLRGDQLERLGPSAGFTGIERLVSSSPAGTLINTGSGLMLEGQPLFEHAATIRSFLVDREGSLWIATPDDGLYRLRRSSVSALGKPEGLVGENLYPIVEGPPGTIWLGSAGGGLARVTAGRVETFESAPGRTAGPVLTILPDGRGGAWTGGVGVQRFEDVRFHRDGLDPRFAEDEVRALFRDSASRIWVGTKVEGLFCFDDGRWQHWSAADGLPDAPLRVLAEDPVGALWIGTNGGGVARFSNGSFEVLTTAGGLPSDLVRAILIDPDGIVWLATENRGLVRLDARGVSLAHATLTVYRRADGLFADGLHQILDDRRGSLWMSTNRGIFSVARAELDAFAAGHLRQVTSVSYTEGNGLRNREANGGVQSAGIRASDGRLWFPTQAGAAIIDPGHLVTSTEPPPLVLESLLARGKGTTRTIEIGTPAAPHRLELPPPERNFEIAYTALTFVSPEQVRFRYRLLGLQEEWTEAGNRRRAIFTNVPPGRYRFEVEAVNGVGVWNRAGPSLDLTLAPRFEETRWFTGLVSAALVAMVLAFGLWRARLNRRHQRGLEQTVRERTEELAQEKERVECALARQQEQAAQLRELDEAKNRFFANISHELRTPLTLLLGPLLDAEAGDHSILAAQAPAMRRNALRLRRMIGQLLDLQKADAASFELRLAPTDLAALCRRAVEAFSLLATRRGVTLTVRIPKSEVIAEADAEQIEKILANLLSNALKCTEAGGAIEVILDEVVLGEGSTECRIRVRDTGIGIPAEALARLFDRFYQVDSSSTRAREGMGIGLALARELARLHGGSLEVTSTLGEGSTFTLTLPTADEPHLETPYRAAQPEELRDRLEDIAELLPPTKAPLVARQTEESTATVADRRRLLIVDDNDDLRAYLRRTLESRYEVLAAEDGEAGLDLALRELPDLVIADVMMPRMDGFALGRALRDDPQAGGIPLLYLTARAGDADALQGFASGAVAYITKPFSSALLLARVEALLRQQERLRARLQAQSAEGRDSGSADTSQQGAFETQLRAIIQAHLHDDEFGVEQLAFAAAASRPTLFRRLKEEAGISPSKLLRDMRLERAESLLAAGEGNVSEVAYAVGFVSLAGFSRAYKRRFGVPPASHLRSS